MVFDNNATQLRRELLIQIAKLYLNGTLFEDIDRIPIAMRPRNTASTRCCVYRDRVLIKYRCMAILGMGVEEETDELRSLASYADEALTREEIIGPILTVLDEACSACIQSNYFITNACRGCLARPCTLNCPKKAIDVEDGQAEINPDKCINCGRCMQVCPYHAIIFVPIPCEEACPVGAISKGEGGKECIDHSLCIHCGKCLRACPFSAIMEKSQLLDVLKGFTVKRPMVAMIAPSIIGQFNASLEQITGALLELGFSAVIEVASGAEITAEREAEEFQERMQRGDRFMTTSCCPAYTEAVEKHIPALRPFVSSTQTPMHYTAEMAAQEMPDATRVFIGPCVAKKEEGRADNLIDYVLSFEELGAMLVAKDIDVDSCQPATPFSPAGSVGRGFPVSGGVASAVTQRTEQDGTPVVAELMNGLTKHSLKRLKVYPKIRGTQNFLEVMSCEGGCIGGPCCVGNEKVAAKKVEELVKASSDETAPSTDSHVDNDGTSSAA